MSDTEERIAELSSYIETLEDELEDTNRGLVALTLELEQSQERYRNIFDNSVEGIVITDALSRILEVNKAFEAITGYSAEEVIGQNTTLLKSEWHDAEFYQEMWKSLTEKGVWQGEIMDRRKDGAVFIQHLSICTVKNDDGIITNFIGILDDITLKKESERKIEQLAYFDHLTKLPNRTLFHDRLRHAIVQAKREHRKLAVLFIDLDNFKNINDTLGHLVGDKFLIDVSQKLTGSVRERDTVARLGGDEFVILIEELHDPEDAAKVARKVIHEMTKPFVIDGNEVFSGASIGISIFPDDGADDTTLIKHADTAMYTAKSQGKNDYRFFIDDMNVRAFERVRTETDLRHAVEEKSFVLHYQPRVDLTTDRIVGAEALIRWQHPDFGLIPPYKFIPLAEEINLIEPVSEWVIDTAARQVKDWVADGLNPPRLSINVCARQLHKPTFAQDILDACFAAGLDPNLLEVEITEGSFIANPEDAITRLKALRDGGVTISIDDFGTGYSSLSYLIRLPVDIVKIDQSFIHALAEGGEAKTVVEAIIALSHKMNLKVVAEGVETEEQLAFLKDQGCDEVQGFFFHRPMSAEDYGAALIARK